jgi:hypothetical protein
LLNAQPNLGADLELRQPDEHVEGIGDAAIGGIVQRDHPKVGMAAVDLLEDRRDTADLHELDGLAEAFDGRDVAKAILGAKIGDLEHLLQRARAAHDLAEDGPDGLRVERTLVGLEHVVQHFLFSCWGKDFRSVIVLEFADLGGDGGAFVDKLEDMQVQLVDLSAKVSQRGGRPRRCGAVGALGLPLHKHSRHKGCCARSR